MYYTQGLQNAFWKKISTEKSDFVRTHINTLIDNKATKDQ
jgi:hypothetical protein